MIKIIKALMVGLALTTFASCSGNEAQPFDEPEVNSDTLCYVTVPDTTKTLTADRAMMIAARHSGTGADSRTAGRLPASIDAVNDEDGNPLMYVVNYTDNKGFVILSASKEYYPILAESDEGSFDIRNLEPEHPVNLWLDEQKFLVEHIDALPDSVKTRAASLWMEYNYDRAAVSAAIDSRANYPEKPQVYYDSLRRWTLDPNIEVYTYEDYKKTYEYIHLSDWQKQEISQGIWAVGNSNYGSIESSTLVIRKKNYTHFNNRLGQILWEQEGGFNKYVPTRIGCAPVAAGQIMKYYQHPSSIDWKSMHNILATDAAAAFLRELGEKCGIEYENNETEANIDNVKNALLDYGYSVQKLNHDAFKVATEVENERPVYMRGTRKNPTGKHAWVCDGVDIENLSHEVRFMTIDYRPATYLEPTLMVEGYNTNVCDYENRKFHYNWGYCGEHNGYFDDANISFMDNDGVLRDYRYDRIDLFIKPLK